MNSKIETPDLSTRAAALKIVERWLGLPIVVIGFGAAAYGLVNHKEFFFTLGINGIAIQIASTMSNRWLLKSPQPPTPFEQGTANFKAILITMPIAIALSIGFILLFPGWFPSSCSLPPRH